MERAREPAMEQAIKQVIKRATEQANLYNLFHPIKLDLHATII